MRSAVVNQRWSPVAHRVRPHLVHTHRCGPASTDDFRRPHQVWLRGPRPPTPVMLAIAVVDERQVAMVGLQARPDRPAPPLSLSGYCHRTLTVGTFGMDHTWSPAPGRESGDMASTDSSKCPRVGMQSVVNSACRTASAKIVRRPPRAPRAAHPQGPAP